MRKGQRARDLEVHNASNGANRWLKSPPLRVPPVFALFQQVLAAPVVWMLIEGPGAILDVGRVDVAVAPAVLQVGHVFAELYHLAVEVRTFVNADPVPAGCLECLTIKIC